MRGQQKCKRPASRKKLRTGTTYQDFGHEEWRLEQENSKTEIRNMKGSLFRVKKLSNDTYLKGKWYLGDKNDEFRFKIPRCADRWW